MDALDDLRQKIDTYGWAYRLVVDEDPALCLCYAVGLTRAGHPEIAMTGLPPEAGVAFLTLAGEFVAEEGGRFIAGEGTTGLTDGTALRVLGVTDTSGLTANHELFGEEVRALQIVWTDSQGRSPWTVGYANPPGSQPLLGPV